MTDLRQGVTPIQHEVFDEIERATAKFPTWPWLAQLKSDWKEPPMT